MATFASTNANVIWQTTSVHGNTIYLYEEDYLHLIEHPEMIGQEDLMKRAIESPIVVREGLYPDSCAFEHPSTTNPDGIRVFVKHDRETFLSGGIEGHVTTAYPIEPKKYRSRVGPVIASYPLTKEKKS